MSKRREYTRPYPEAFRRDAVALVASSGRPIREIRRPVPADGCQTGVGGGVFTDEAGAAADERTAGELAKSIADAD